MMNYASMLAVLTGGAEDALILSAGVQLLSKEGGEVRVILASPTISGLLLSDLASLHYVSQEVINAVDEGDQAARRRTELLIAETSQREGLGEADDRGRIVLLGDKPTREIEMQHVTPLCDLILVSQSTFKGLGVWSGLVSRALMRGKIPVYIARRVNSERGVAVIAWDGSEAAGRAVRAALPLLADATQVVIIQDPDHISASHLASAAPNALVSYLKLHGVTEARVLSQSGLSRHGGLGAAARQARGQLMIAGAFSHARAMEVLFGGPTDDLLQPTAQFNLLLSH